jgi:GNAT superfamily N-acetyltransferase
MRDELSKGAVTHETACLLGKVPGSDLDGACIMQLKDIYETGDPMPSQSALKILYTILSERDESTNISHRRMPDWQDHVAFVCSRPYKYWWLVLGGTESQNIVGAAYLSRQNEIGVFILKEYQGLGLGPDAVKLIIKVAPPGSPLLANINPRNARSIKMFENLGFKHVQNTYRLDQKQQ